METTNHSSASSDNEVQGETILLDKGKEKVPEDFSSDDESEKSDYESEGRAETQSPERKPGKRRRGQPRPFKRFRQRTNAQQQQPPRGRGSQRGRGNRGRGSQARGRGYSSNQPVVIVNNGGADPKPEQKRDTRQVLTVEYALGDKQIAHLENFVFQGRKIQLSKRTRSHSHPICALERRYAEEWMVRVANPYGQQIVDIGGAPARHYAANRQNVWSCCPLTTAVDASRQVKIRADPNVGNFHWCQHIAQNCNCVTPDVYISVHSIYYLDISAILSLLAYCSSHVILAAVHRFRDPIGNLCAGEMAYERRTTSHGMKLVANVRGNNVPYVHDPFDWMHVGGYAEFGGRACIATLQHTIGDTLIYLITPCPVVAKEELTGPEIFERNLASNDYYGELFPSGTNEAQQIVNYAQVDMPECAYFSVGSFVLLHFSRTTQVVIPKQLLSHVKLFLAGKTRDKHTFKSACDTAKRKLRDMKNLTSEQQSLAVIPTVLLAFCCDIKATADSITAMSIEHEDIFEHYNRQLQEPTVPHLSRFNWQRYKVLIAMGMLTAAAWATRDDRTPGPAPGALFIWEWLAKAARWLWSRRKIATAWLATFLSNGVAADGISPFLVRYGGNWVKAKLITARASQQHRVVQKSVTNYVTYCPRNRPISPLDKESKIRGAEIPCVETFGCTLRGVGLVDLKPVVPRSCYHSEYVSIRNRILAPQTGSDEPWHYMTDVAAYFFDDFYQPETLKKVTFDKWVKHYPPARREQVKEARQLARDRGIIQKELGVKLFVKRECLPKCLPDEDISFDPRAIQGNHDVVLAQLGPWYSSDSEYLQKTWGKHDGSFGIITYAAGLNAQDIGEWFDQAHDAVIDSVELTNDARRWDMSIRRAGTEFMATVISQRTKKWHDKPIPRRVASLFFNTLDCTGVSHQGIHFKTEGRIRTGGISTSAGNSTLNAHLHLTPIIMVLGRFPTRSELMLIVMGDDMYMVLNRTLANKVYHVLASFLTFAGIQHKLTLFTDQREGQFCSSRFWPTLNGTVLGPKPFRTLSKTFYCKHALSDKNARGWLRGVVLGWYADSAHVPVLRVVIRRMLEITSADEPKFYEKIFRARSARVEKADEDEMATMCDVVYPGGYEAILEIEKLCEGIKSLPSLLESPLLTGMVLADIEEPTAFSKYIPAELFGPLWSVMAALIDDSDPAYLLDAWDAGDKALLELPLADFYEAAPLYVNATVLWAPILEELLRCVSGWMTPCWAMLEIAQNIVTGTVHHYGPALALHLSNHGLLAAFGIGAYPFAVGNHLFYNLRVMFSRAQLMCEIPRTANPLRMYKHVVSCAVAADSIAKFLTNLQ
jgi:hypothetical protein